MAALLTRLLGLGPGTRNWPNPGLPTADVPKPNAMDPMTWRFPLEPIFGPLPLAPTPAIDGINGLITGCITHEKTSSDLICAASLNASLLVSDSLTAAHCGYWANHWQFLRCKLLPCCRAAVTFG